MHRAVTATQSLVVLISAIARPTDRPTGSFTLFGRQQKAHLLFVGKWPWPPM